MMSIVRKQILLEEVQNERLRQLHESTGASESEIMRRALEAYDPEGAESLESHPEIQELVKSLDEQNARTRRALDDAEKELALTREYFDSLRKESVPKSEEPLATP